MPGTSPVRPRSKREIYGPDFFKKVDGRELYDVAMTRTNRLSNQILKDELKLAIVLLTAFLTPKAFLPLHEEWTYGDVVIWMTMTVALLAIFGSGLKRVGGAPEFHRQLKDNIHDMNKFLNSLSANPRRIEDMTEQQKETLLDKIEHLLPADPYSVNFLDVIDASAQPLLF